MESASFRIPLAEDARGRLVSPEDAERGRRYVCPACTGAVDLHAGEKKRRHFHHRSSACSAETVVHVSAKRAIVQAVEAWRAGGAAPVFVRRCAHEGCEATTRQPMPKKILRAVEELAAPSGHVVDVALLGPADLPVAAIEVRVSHAVDDDKAFELGMPWIEVDGAAACASGGRVLEPVRDRFLPWLCAEHEGARGEAWRREQESRRERSAVVRDLDYRIEDFPGYRIETLATCPNGHRTPVFAWDGREPPWPRPPHVVAVEKSEDVVFDRATKGLRGVLPFRRAWASACIRCGARLRVVSKPPA